MKITIAQLNPVIGDFEQNLQSMKKAALQAIAQDSTDMVVYPELSLCGYYPGDLMEEPYFEEALREAKADFYAFTIQHPEVYFVMGCPTKPQDGSVIPGQRWHNSLLVINNGSCVMEYHKQLLPTYGVFDERRHFEPGPDVAKIFKIKSTRVGFLICEDGWNDNLQDYAINPFERLQDAAPDLVVSINASPSNVGKLSYRHKLFSQASVSHNFPIVYVNQVGGQDQLVFDGASFVVTPQAGLVWAGAVFEEEVTTLSWTGTHFEESDGAICSSLGVVDYTCPSEFYYRQTILGLKDYARKCGFKSAVVGSSGGIDSALTLALAVEALGSANVTAITMPSEYSSEGSVSDSAKLCKKLGVMLHELPIKSMVNALSSEFVQAIGTPLTGVSAENIQARLRGVALMAYSNQFGHLLLTTGNKSEVSVGYCTLYGDTNGGLGLIGDLYKTEIFELCRYINRIKGDEIIPLEIIDKPPSAELSPGQQDSDSLPPYEVLDELLKVLIEGKRLDPSEYEAARKVYDLAIPSGLVAKIQKMIARNEYKRKQMPPVIKVRARAFGSGRQVPIAAKHF